MKNTTRRGFTLIELLIVVVIIGILAAIAIPKFSNTKEKAYIAAMKSDLRNLATAQESYASDNNGLYGTEADVQFTGSAGVTLSATPNAGLGWAATASHASTTKTCAIYSGTPTAIPAPATNEGEPMCTT
jgi:type IV pilus assembly protein PilA